MGAVLFRDLQWAVKPVVVRTTQAAEGMRSTVWSTWKSVGLILR